MNTARSRSWGPIFMGTSNPVAMQDVMRFDDTEAERLVESQRWRVGDLRADAKGLRAGDLAGRRNQRRRDTAAAKRLGDADKIDGDDLVARSQQLGEAGEPSARFGDDHVVAATSGEEVPCPLGPAAVGDFSRNCRVEVKARV